MIETYCVCQKPIRAAESAVGSSVTCGKCGAPVTLISAEAIEPGGAVGDFDARLVIRQGPAGVGQVLALGGVPDLELGKSTDRHIQLPGTMVSRAHARLNRLDFGPSRWQIIDTQSRNGVFVNDQQIGEAELQDGDVIRIGDYELQYLAGVPEPAPAPVLTSRGGVVCPGCHQTFPADTRICIGCGINIKTGRPLVTSRALDEDALAIRTDTWVKIVSLLLPFGLIPIASEAFGTKNPKAIWWISGITIFASLLFFIPYYTSDIAGSPIARSLVMWVGSNDAAAARVKDKLHREHPDDSQKDIDDVVDEAVARQAAASQGQFHIYQLLTQALLHAGVEHLAGNMVFMLVFGIRVNELLGNVKFAVLYPILAILSALIFFIAALGGPLTPSLGASGAIMGLAGMYFVFFPVQKVVMVIWLRWFWLRISYKVFRMSGFWLLVLWVGLNDVLPTVLHGAQTGDGVAHWAHLGGFISGAVIAIGLLVTRQVNAHGSDVLSMMLGPRAWKIIGRGVPGAVQQ